MVRAGAIAVIVMAITAAGALAPGPVRAAGRPVSYGTPHPSVVLIGIPGLAWSDISLERTPTVWRLARSGATASMSVRSIGSWTCPMDGWLSVSAGSRAADPQVPCGSTGKAPVRSGSGWTVPEVPRAQAVNWASNFRAAVGSLGDAAHRGGVRTAAVGPGAAAAIADSQGKVDAYAARPAGLRDWGRYRVTTVEVPDIAGAYLGAGRSAHDPAQVSARERATAAQRADAEVRRVVDAVPAGTNVIVAGISDVSDVPRLRAVIAHGPAFPAGRVLTSPSTRRDGLTILPDLTATALTAARLPVPGQVVGKAWAAGPARGDLTEAAAAERAHDVAAQVLRVTLPGYFIAFVIAQLLVYAIGYLALQRRHGRRRGRLLGLARGLALLGAAVPAATYLVTLTRWWQAAHPAAALFGGVLAGAAAIAGLATAGPWRRDVLAPGTIVAGFTALLLGVDLLRGSPLQMYSLMGYSPLVGGRYYGLGNIAFATFATGALFLAAGIAHILLLRGRRGWAIAAVIAIGVAADVLSGSPALGAKFGGTIALVPGTAVTAMIVAGKRVTPVRVAAFAGLGVATIATICYLDYLRPPAQRTHLGRFADQLLHGQAVPVVTRKLMAMLHTVGNIPLTLLVAAGLAFLFVVLLRVRPRGPGRIATPGTGPLAAAYTRAPALRAGLAGTLVTSMSGFAIEDSGIAVPAIALTLAVPLAFAAAARAHQSERNTTMTDASIRQVSTTMTG